MRPGAGEADLDLTNITIWLLAALSAGLCLWLLSRPGMLFGVTEYDDAVYFGSAVRLVHGAIPYRDFYLVQPPGSVVLLTPLAWLARAIGTRDALAVGRLLMPLVAAGQVLLVGKLVRHKGLAATFAACSVMAVYTDAITSTHTIVLEPLLDLFCLGALVVAFDAGRLRQDRRVLYAGLLLGGGMAVKLFAVVPAVVLAGHYLGKWRSLARLVAGGIGGFALLAGPFFLLAPADFAHQVVSVQLHRELLVRTPLVLRFSHMLSLSGFSSNYIGTTAPAAIVIIVGVLLVAFLAVGYVLAARTRGGLSQLDTMVLAATVLVVAMFLVPAEFYYHYAEVLAPFLALTIGTAAGGIAAAIAAGRSRQPGAERATVQPLRIVAAALAGAAGLGQIAASSGIAGMDSASGIDAVVPAGACALSDSPALLVTANRLVSGVAGCPQIVDGLGVSLSVDTGKSPAILQSVTPKLVATWTRLVAKAHYVVLSPAADLRIPLLGSVTAELSHNFHLRRERSGILIYVRNGSPSG